MDILGNSLYPGNGPGTNGFTPNADLYVAKEGKVFVADVTRGTVSVVSTTTNTVVGTIFGLGNALYLAYDNSTNELFVASSEFGSLTIINAATDEVTATAGAGIPSGMVYDGQGQVFVSQNGNVSVFEVSMGSFEYTITTGLDPEGLAYDNATGQVFVANEGSNSVSVISAANNSVVATIPVGAAPRNLTYDPGTGDILVANSGSNNVSVIDGSNDTVVRSVNLTGAPVGMTDDPGNGTVFVSLPAEDELSVIQVTSGTVVANLSVGTGLLGGAYVAASELIYFVDPSPNGLLLVNASDYAIGAGVPISAQPVGLALDTGRNQLFVADAATFYPNQTSFSDSGNVTIVAPTTGRIVASIDVGGSANAVVYDPVNGSVFVGDASTDSLGVINDTNDSVVATVPVPGSPTALAYDPAQNAIFAAESPDLVSEIDASSYQLLHNFTVGTDPEGIAFDPAQGEVFVTNNGSGNVSVINATRAAVVANVPVGQGPVGVAYDAPLGDVLVAVWDSSEVAVLSATSNAVLKDIPIPGLYPYAPSGLFGIAVVPSSTDVWVTAVLTPGPPIYSAGEVLLVSVSTSKIVKELSLGPSPQAVLADPTNGDAYVASAYNGSIFTVGGSTLGGPVPVTFRAVGLPSGAPWQLTYGSPPSTGSNTTFGPRGAITIDAPIGNLPFHVLPPAGYGVAQVTGPHFPTQGNATIIGPATLVVRFGPLESVTFQETGLPNGSTWQVTLTTGYAHGGSNAGPIVLSTNGSSISVLLVKGAWKFVLSGPSPYTPRPAHGSISVPDRPVTRTVLFRVPR